MANLRRAVGGAVLAVGMVAATVTGQPAGTTASQPVSYTGLGKFIRGLRGKVVVVDFWADY
jgi:hypothetical protein